MTAKKKWISKVNTELNETKSIENISWSSDSEEEEEKKKNIKTTSKKPKLYNEDSSVTEIRTKSWIELNNSYITPTKLPQDYASPESSIIIDEDCSQKMNTVRNLNESPILTSRDFRPEQLSPILTQTNRTFVKEPSPVIGHRETILKKLKQKLNRQKECKIEDFCSPQASQSSRIIIDTQSSSQTSREELPEISQIISDSPAVSSSLLVSSSPIYIDPIPSQKSSPISKISSFSSKSSSTESIQKRPRKKRKHKKGGLADQLQKALRVQKTKILMWQHEEFLRQSKKNHYSCDSNEEEQKAGFDFYVLNKRKEYGFNILECKNNSDELLLILGNNGHNLSNITLSEGSWFKILPPFSTEEINYKSKDTLCYFNCHKFIKIKTKS